MRIVFHLGVHGTDGDRMIKMLLNNREYLQRHGTEVVPPNRHRGLFEEALAALNGGASTPEMEEIMLDAVLETDAPKRVIFSSASFMGLPARAVGGGAIYPQAGARIAALANLFPSAQSEFFVAIKNPATLLADVLAQSEGTDYAALMQGSDPADLGWRPAVQRMAQAAQGRRLVVWCHEDVPLIWPEVVRMVGAMPAEAPLNGGLMYMHELVGDRGLPPLRGELAGRDNITVTTRRQIFADQLSRNARPEVVEQQIDLPGWTQETVDRITARYHQDIAQIAVMPGIEFLLP